ncbi:hypothetical protein Asppvi_000716 [Aspergillus pseudoviridinutans]|uniref:Uncharacterized protein n=1 Tax=Aspergillus pseudoviridinutans TaxID=1517512 RepID=A0A9P3ER11_9EURO|nr:uncharacterized protein Asppvi_000716 [Aspergillus pseudoviridinutans]GIJ82210.1 hypothetical protein Asppvi_000716 [Aspergillus pseudoviridinutans]
MTRDTSKEAMKAKQSAIINHLQQLRQALSSVRTPNFEIDELSEMGLKAVRVELAPDKEVLDFNPCFFLPQPTSMLEYPITEGGIPDLETKRTDETYPWKAELSRLTWHIVSQVVCKRSGIYTDGRECLGALSPLGYPWEIFPRVEGRVSIDAGDRIGNGHWYTSSAYLDNSVFEDESAAMPHAMIILCVHYRANDTSLTHAEVCGLLHYMYHWYDLEFEQYATGPVSIRLLY